jgi:hypothetical protein
MFLFNFIIIVSLTNATSPCVDNYADIATSSHNTIYLRMAL